MTEQLDVLDPVTRQHVERPPEALQREFAGVFSQETIARYIAESTVIMPEQPGRALLAEFLGTFALVFFAAGSAALAATTHPFGLTGAALAAGLAVAAVIYAIGHISGAHINPAVTLAFAVARHFPASRVIGYWGGTVRRGDRRGRGSARPLGNVAHVGATCRPAPRAGVPLGDRADRDPDVRRSWPSPPTPGRSAKQPRSRLAPPSSSTSIVRRPDLRGLDEPCALARPCVRSPGTRGALDLPRRAAGRRGDRRARLPARAGRGR